MLVPAYFNMDWAQYSNCMGQMRSATVLLLIATIAGAFFTIPVPSESPASRAGGDEGVEPNDDLPTAHPLKSGETGRYWLGEGVDDVDWFSVQAEKGKVLNATLYTLDWPFLNASLEVYTIREGIPFREGYSTSPHRYETVVVVTPLTGSHYIRVFVEAGGGSGNYTLTVNIQEPYEVKNGGHYSGTLYNNTNHPSDIYKVWLNAGDIFRAGMNETPIPPASDVSIDLYLMDLWPLSHLYTYLDLSWWGDPSEALEARAPHEGYFFILVTAFNGSGRYELNITIEAGQPGEDDFPPRTRAVYATTIFNDTIHQSMDHYDWYRFSGKTGNSVSATVSLRDGWRSGLFELFLLDERLTVIRSVTNFVPPPSPKGKAATTDRLELAWRIEADGIYYFSLMAKWGLSIANPMDLTDAPAATAYSISFTVARENRPPFVATPPLVLYTEEDTELHLELSEIFSDPDLPDGDRISFTAIGSGHLSTRLTGPSELAVVPIPNWSGSEELVVKALDSMGASARWRTTITVLPINDPPLPRAPPPPLVLSEGVTYPSLINVSELFEDPDLFYGDKLTFSVSPSPLELRIDPGGMLECGPVRAPPGDYRVNVWAFDTSGAEASVELNIRVLRVPKPPMATSLSFLLHIDEDTVHVGPAISELFYDPEGQSLSLVFRNEGRVSVSVDETGLLRITPKENWSGSEEIYIEAWDTEGLSTSATLMVVVKPIPDPPTFISIQPPENLSALEGTDLVLRVTATDSDSTNISYEWRLDGKTINASSKHGNALSIKALTPGNHIVTVVACDPEGLLCSHTWALTILEKPKEPNGPKAARAIQASGAAAVVGLAAWVAVLVGVSEHGKYAIFKMLFIPLYTKLHKEEVLDHFTRGRIYGLVESNPGIHYTLIKKRLGVGNGTLTYHLSTLQREGFIRSEWDGLYKRFYPAQMPYSKRGDVELTPVQKEILELIKKTPSISQKEICHSTGLSKRVVSYHISKMVEAKLVRVEKRGKGCHCYPSERPW